jgi:hypothetical protein
MVGAVGAVAPTAVPGVGVPHDAQNRAPATSGVPHPEQAGATDAPQCGQNRASAGTDSPHVEQFIRHRVLNRVIRGGCMTMQ